MASIIHWIMENKKWNKYSYNMAKHWEHNLPCMQWYAYKNELDIKRLTCPGGHTNCHGKGDGRMPYLKQDNSR